MNLTDHERIDRAWRQVRGVHDPELPFLTVEEMGMVRGVRIHEEQQKVDCRKSPIKELALGDVERDGPGVEARVVHPW